MSQDRWVFELVRVEIICIYLAALEDQGGFSENRRMNEISANRGEGCIREFVAVTA